MQAALLGAAVATAVACGSYALLDVLGAKTRRRAALEQLAEYDKRDERDRRRLQPLSRRVGTPLATWAAAAGRAATPAGYAERIRTTLNMAGRTKPDALDRFLAVQVFSLGAGVIAAGLVGSALPLSGGLRVAVVAIVAFGFALGPRAAVDRAARQRQNGIRAGLPNFVDLLAVSVEAGFGLDQALERVTADADGPLADELRRLQGDMRAGASRAAAMRALVERTDVPELRSFVSAVLQTEAFGVPIAPTLRAQAQEMRVRRRQSAQAQAQKAPVKMLIPTVFCIFPSIFVVVLAPALLNIADAFR